MTDSPSDHSNVESTDETAQPKEDAVRYPLAADPDRSTPWWPTTRKEIIHSLTATLITIGLFLHGVSKAPMGDGPDMRAVYGVMGVLLGWVALILCGYLLSIAGCLITGILLIGGPVVAVAYLGYWLAQ